MKLDNVMCITAEQKVHSGDSRTTINNRFIPSLYTTADHQTFFITSQWLYDESIPVFFRPSEHPALIQFKLHELTQQSRLFN